MDNYSNYTKEYGNINTNLYCKKCGRLIDETMTIAEATEYEHEEELCEDCFKIGVIVDSEPF